jgi:hypothetical protein
LHPGALKWTAVALLSTLLLYVFYYIKKLTVLNRFDPATRNVRGNVEGLISTLSGYVAFYRRSYTVLYPIFFVLALLFIGLEHGTEKFLANVQRPVTVVSLVLLAGLYYLLSTTFVKWYLNRLYGKHLEKLKSLLSDIHG